MTDEQKKDRTPESNAIIPRPRRGEVLVGKSRVLDRLALDAVASIRAGAPAISKRMYRVGEHELCAEDYEQMGRWVHDLELWTGYGLTIELLAELFQSEADESTLFTGRTLPWVESGRIVEAHFSESLLEAIEAFFLGAPKEELFSEKWLSQFMGTHKAPMPKQPTTLDLTGVPELRALNCRNIWLKYLDLSGVPELQELDCQENQLAHLDLSGVPKLQKLDCAENQLTELDLSRVPKLQTLGCRENRLTELDLSRVPKLQTLDCRENRLTHLDLRDCSESICLRRDKDVTVQVRKEQRVW